MPLKSITFVTGNANKLAEVQRILGSAIAVTAHDLDLEEIQGSIEEVTSRKCEKAAEALKGPVVVEDTSLCFNALNGLPGPYVKWFFKSIGHEGLNNLLAAYDDKSAKAVCTFAFSAGPGYEPRIFQGTTDGRIVPARGPGRFGWDAVFEYSGNGQTFGEMDKDFKNSISHRGKALALLKDFLENYESSS